jgi:serine/threonine protein kinase
MSGCSDQGLRIGPGTDPDRYVLGSTVGSGAEGILYRGARTSAGIDLDVAIKMLHPCFSSRVDEWYARCSEQVELGRSLQVPGVVGVREGFLGPLPHPPGRAGTDRSLYLVMNWVEGESLDEWVRRRPDRDPLEALKLLLGMAAALDVMHSGQLTGGIPVMHCDVKPANVLVTTHGTVLVDFGLIRALPDGPRFSVVTGTPGYAAPEVVEAGVYSPAADRYSVGAVAFFLLTGMDPPITHEPTALRASLAGVPALASQPEVVDHVMAMLDGDPYRRPGDLANWVSQLRRSSLTDVPSVLAPEAPSRNPQPGLATGNSSRRLEKTPDDRRSRAGRSGQRQAAAERAGEVSFALSTLAQSLYEVDSDERLKFVYGRADAGGRTGASAREIIALLSPIWVQYLQAKEVVDQLDVAVGASRDTEVERLLGPDVITLADGTTTSVSFHLQDLQQHLAKVLQGADRLVNGFLEAKSRLDTMAVAVLDLKKRAEQLGVAGDAEMAVALRLLTETNAAFDADPLGIGLTDEIVGAVDRARAHVEALESIRHDVPTRLAEAASVMEEIARLVAEDPAILAETKEKIAHPQGLLELIDPSVVDGSDRSLRPWLVRITEGTDAGEWRSVSTGLENWRRVADPVLADARRIKEANSAPLVRRNDLRGLLRSYRAKAVAAGRAEDLTLRRLYEEACDALYCAPCDLVSAEAKAQAYIEAVNATPVEATPVNILPEGDAR